MMLALGCAAWSAAAFGNDDVASASGVNIHFTDARPGELEMMKAAGFRHIRMDLTWAATEKKKGEYDFSAYERLTAALETHGMKPYYILDYSNPLYEEARSVRTGEGRIAFTKWALAAVGHFKGRGICWEIWNEPNGGFWAPRADVNEYTALAVMVSKAIKEAHPEEIVTGPATSTIDMAFLEGCFKAGLLEWWDAVTVHPYRHTGPEAVDLEYEALRRLIARHAPEGKEIPVLSGEWGYSAVWSGHDADSQGRMLARQWLVNAANSIPVSIWYDWHDDGLDPKEPEHHFGTVRRHYHQGRDPVYDPKPAYHAAKTFNTVLKGYRFVKRISLSNTDHHALLFEKSGRHLVAAWSTLPGTHEAVMPSDDGLFSVTSHLGEKLPDVSATDGKLATTLGGSPKYYEFSKSNAKLAAAPEAIVTRIAIAPSTGKEIIVKIENLSGKELKAKVALSGTSGLKVAGGSREITLSPEHQVTDVVFPLKEIPSANYQVGAKLEFPNSVVSGIAPRLFSPPDAATLAGARAVPEGDPDVGGTFKLEPGDAPEPFPGGTGTVMKLDYAFEDGWKYIPVLPSGDPGPRPIESRAGEGGTRVLFGMWIHGDAGNLVPRVRVIDANGRVWQPSGPPIKWKGWKYIEMKLDETTACWGGSDPDVKRGPKFPLKWQAPFLLDNTSKVAASGTIHFSTPAAILE